MSHPNPYCERLRAQFDAYHDGELSPFLGTVVGRHLEACAGCREEYASLVRAIEAVRRRPAPEVPARVLRKVVEQLSGPDGGATLPRPVVGPDLAPGLEI